MESILRRLKSTKFELKIVNFNLWKILKELNKPISWFLETRINFIIILI